MIATLALSFAPALLPQCLETHPRASDGLPGPEGGVLVPDGPYPAGQPAGATLGGNGRVAFTARIEGPARNQGIFVADELGIRAIALGCGGDLGSGQLGACGDPAPTGGTFAGFDHGGWWEPELSAAGDVLFLADVAGAATTRGVFLYRAATGAIETIVALGDPTPLGQPVSGVGPSRLNVHGDVVSLIFLDAGPGTPDFALLHVSNGVRTLLAAPGLPGPTGPYARLGQSLRSHADGTWSPAGPAPAIADDGRVLFWASEPNSAGWEGLVVQQPGGAPAWVVYSGDVSHGGLPMFHFDAPCFGYGGELGFTGTSMHNPGSTTFAVFSGVPGSWRTVIGSGATLGGLPLSFDSRTYASRWLAPDGSAVLWARVYPNGAPGEGLVLLVRPTGALEVLVRQGDAHPLGVVGPLAHRPAIDAAGRVSIAAELSGGSATRASWVLAPCGTPVAHCTATLTSTGCLPRIGSSGAASATSTAPFHITADAVTNNATGLLFYGAAPASTPFGGGTLCVAPPHVRGRAATASGALGACSGHLEVDFAPLLHADPALTPGASVHVQWLLRDAGASSGVALSDALTFVVQP